MKVLETKLPGVLVIEPRVFGDFRGYFLEMWHNVRYQESKISAEFVQANFAQSTKGVLRGLHYQLVRPQGKLVWVSRGEVFDVVVDIRTGSPTFGHWFGEVLSEKNHRQLYIPPGYAHGYCVLSDVSDFMYFCTQLYDPEDERGIPWNDNTVGIPWPIEQPILSDKDCRYSPLTSIPQGDLPVWTKGR